MARRAARCKRSPALPGTTAAPLPRRGRCTGSCPSLPRTRPGTTGRAPAATWSAVAPPQRSSRAFTSAPCLRTMCRTPIASSSRAQRHMWRTGSRTWQRVRVGCGAHGRAVRARVHAERAAAGGRLGSDPHEHPAASARQPALARIPQGQPGDHRPVRPRSRLEGCRLRRPKCPWRRSGLESDPARAAVHHLARAKREDEVGGVAAGELPVLGRLQRRVCRIGLRAGRRALTRQWQQHARVRTGCRRTGARGQPAHALRRTRPVSSMACITGRRAGARTTCGRCHHLRFLRACARQQPPSPLRCGVARPEIPGQRSWATKACEGRCRKGGELRWVNTLLPFRSFQSCDLSPGPVQSGRGRLSILRVSGSPPPRSAMHPCANTGNCLNSATWLIDSVLWRRSCVPLEGKLTAAHTRDATSRRIAAMQDPGLSSRTTPQKTQIKATHGPVSL